MRHCKSEKYLFLLTFTLYFGLLKTTSLEIIFFQVLIVLCLGYPSSRLSIWRHSESLSIYKTCFFHMEFSKYFLFIHSVMKFLDDIFYFKNTILDLWWSLSIWNLMSSILFCCWFIPLYFFLNYLSGTSVLHVLDLLDWLSSFLVFCISMIFVFLLSAL